jgi:DcmR-like sensory protein
VSWKSFMDNAPTADHAVQIWDELDELTQSVARYLDAGFRTGAPAVVIATPEHWRRFAHELEARGWDPRLLEEQGLLTYGDAGQTLAALMEGDLPSPDRFEQVVGGLIDAVATRFPEQTIRAFGEMVDLLWQRGCKQGAIALEELWNELQRTRPFALLCGYHLDIFDVQVQAQALPELFRSHTHARPAADASRLAAALDQALADAVGSIGAARIYLDAADHVPRSSLPRAQAVLGWLASTNAPMAAGILERTRAHYLRMRQSPTAA